MVKLYVKDNKILTERQLLQTVGVMRSEPPRQKDLDEWGAYVLQPDNHPSGDVVAPLQTASQHEDGLWYRDYNVRDFTVEELASYKSAKIQQVSDYVNAGVNKQASVYYPQFERNSWPDQRAESEAWLAYVRDGGVEPATPVIDGALRPGESKTEYAKLIVSNAESFKNTGGAAIGALRDVRRSIRNAGSKSEIDAIVESVVSS